LPEDNLILIFGITKKGPFKVRKALRKERNWKNLGGINWALRKVWFGLELGKGLISKVNNWVEEGQE